MVIRSSFLRAVALMGAIAAYGAAHSAGPGVPAHLVAADDLVSRLRAQGEAGQHLDPNGVPHNRYGAAWKNAFAIWTPMARVDAQCSSFVTLVLQVAYPGWTAKKAGFGGASPTAAMYHDAIESNSKGFKKVGAFEQMAPGDFLMAKYLDGSDNTGHAMIVRDADLVGYDAKTKVKTWAVQVIDCSRSFHSDDTRVFLLNNTTAYETQGAGRGWMRVLTKNGAITGYSWSWRNGSTLYLPHQRHLTLGRLAK